MQPNCEFGRHQYLVFELKGIIYVVEVIELTLEEKAGWGINLIKKVKGNNIIKALKWEWH